MVYDAVRPTDKLLRAPLETEYNMLEGVPMYADPELTFTIAPLGTATRRNWQTYFESVVIISKILIK